MLERPWSSTQELLDGLLEQSEMRTVDFKKEPPWTEGSAFARDISAMYNSARGPPFEDFAFIVLGVEENSTTKAKTVTGLSKMDFDDESLVHTGESNKQWLSMWPPYSLEKVTVPATKLSQPAAAGPTAAATVVVVIIVIPTLNHGPISFARGTEKGSKHVILPGTVFFRIGSRTRCVDWSSRFDCRELCMRFRDCFATEVPPVLSTEPPEAQLGALDRAEHARPSLAGLDTRVKLLKLLSEVGDVAGAARRAEELYGKLGKRRFNQSQLHMLRFCVGRNEHPSSGRNVDSGSLADEILQCVRERGGSAELYADMSEAQLHGRQAAAE